MAMGDVHGRNTWKGLVNTQKFDKLVLLGDYFDSFDINAQEQMDNFRDIIAFKQTNPDKVVLLIGNHDFHYLPIAMTINETYSGFQLRYAFAISQLIEEHKHLLQMCYQWENYLFTHAGITHTWLHNAGYNGESVDVFINELFQYQPRRFFFNGNDPYGDNVTQSPIWVRPASLKKNAYKYETVKQVVGHTTVKKLEIVKDQFYFIDTMGTSKEYFIVEDGNVIIKKVYN
jgi:predicted phosphodiesterase